MSATNATRGGSAHDRKNCSSFCPPPHPNETKVHGDLPKRSRKTPNTSSYADWTPPSRRAGDHASCNASQRNDWNGVAYKAPDGTLPRAMAPWSASACLEGRAESSIQIATPPGMGIAGFMLGCEGTTSISCAGQPYPFNARRASTAAPVIPALSPSLLGTIRMPSAVPVIA